MVKAQAKPIFRLLLTLCFIFSCFCFAGEQEPQYDNLSFGVPGRADTIIDRPGYALGYSEYHEQAAWVIYIMTREEATTKEAQRTNKFRSDNHFSLTCNRLSLGEFSESSENGRPFFLFSTIQSFMAGFFCALILPNE